MRSAFVCIMLHVMFFILSLGLPHVSLIVCEKSAFDSFGKYLLTRLKCGVEKELGTNSADSPVVSLIAHYYLRVGEFLITSKCKIQLGCAYAFALITSSLESLAELIASEWKLLEIPLSCCEFSSSPCLLENCVYGNGGGWDEKIYRWEVHLCPPVPPKNIFLVTFCLWHGGGMFLRVVAGA